MAEEVEIIDEEEFPTAEAREELTDGRGDDEEEEA